MSKPCPGWVDIREKVHLCNEGRVDQTLIEDSVPMCRRCRKRKDKFDLENGLRDRQYAEQRARYELQILGYVNTITEAVPNVGPEQPPLSQYMAALEELREVSPWRSNVKPSFRVMIDVLRTIAGLEILAEDPRRYDR